MSLTAALIGCSVTATVIVAMLLSGSPGHAQTSVPTGPTGLTVSSATHDSVTLTWDDPWVTTIESYQILRRSRDRSEYEDGLGAPEFVAIVDTTGSLVTTYTDTSVTARTRYVYRVKATSPHGFSEMSSYANAETPDAPPDTSQSPARGSRPNVVLILADDLGWGDVQPNNPESAMTTPRIDSIAATGAKFSDAHTPSSVCSPTRYGLLTGRYSWRSWLTSSALYGYDRPMIGPDQPTLGTLLQRHGYRTAAVGKWHVGMDFARLSDVDEVNSLNKGIDFDAEIVDGPLNHGFDEFFGTSANLRWAPSVYIRNRRFIANPERESQPASAFVVFEEVLDRLTQEAVSFIEREGQNDAPFFLYLPLNAPHEPTVPNAQFAGLTGLGRYGDFVAQMGWTVGQVLDTHDRVGAHDNTLVIFTSDNGSSMGGIPIPNHAGAEHLSSGGWRGGKGQIYEGGHRVPLLMQWPRGIEGRSTVGATVTLTDLYATIADIVGEEPESGVPIDSVSLLPLLRGEAVTRGVPVVHHSSAGMFALRDGRWKLVFGNGSGLPYPLHGTPFGTPWRLFDLQQDPRETRSVGSAHPDVMARMEATLARIRAAENGMLSGDATLRLLSLAGIDIGPFDPGVRTYTGIVDPAIGTVEVTTIPTETDALVMITDSDGQSGHGRRLVRLDEGTTAITVTVTSPDGNATATYTVTIAREGGPTITGTVEVGEMLTVGTSSITDADGLDNPGYSYQWIRNDGSTDSDIVRATSTTYILATEDEGKTIKVRVSFTDDAGNAETRTSAATTKVSAVVLESELTAGQETDIFPVTSGYSVFGDLGGTLTPGRFVIDGTTYEVQFLIRTSESLWLGMDRELPADFTLRVGDSTYLGSESKFDSLVTRPV